MTDRSMAPVGEALLNAFAPALLPQDPSPATDSDSDSGAGSGEPGAPPGSAPAAPDGPASALPAVATGRGRVVDGIAVTLADRSSQRHQLLFVSTNLAEMLGYQVDQLVGLALPALFEPASAEQLDAIEARLDTEHQVEVSQLLRHRSGHSIAVQATHAALPSIHPEARFRLLLLRDLTRPHRLTADQSVLVDSLARGRDLGSLCHRVARHVEEKLAGSGRCLVGVTDLYGRLEAVVTGGLELDVASRLLQRVAAAPERSVLVDQLPADLAGPVRGSGIHALWAFPALDANGQQQGALVVAQKTQGVPTADEHELLDHLSQVISAGIERAAMEEELAHRSLHDALTRLPNRDLIVDRLKQALARLDRDRASLSVLLADIDRFRSINDTWGPDVGDRVLVEVAQRLLASVRLGDTVGRIAGDRFLVICVANGDLDAATVARRVIGAIAEPILLPGGEELRITVSVGVVAVDDPTQSPTTVIGQAESALGRAVQAGRGNFALFDRGVQREAMARHELEQALHTALDAGELALHYQPVCEIATGRMIGAEALLRWDRPGHGLLGPAQFIDVAEDSGLIVPIGAWVIDEVAGQLASWPKAHGWSPVITVNLSARQLADESLVPTVVSALDRHALPAGRLGFEVTESMKIDDLQSAVDTLSALGRLGCRIAIDDFGIGYATLDYLRRFSMADVIKIDRSFVAGLGRSREDTAIVSASMALASTLDLRVVAEGVEELAQLSRLAALGCHYAQGFGLSKPVPVDEAIEMWLGGTLFDPASIGPARTGDAPLPWPGSTSRRLDRLQEPAGAPRPAPGSAVGDTSRRPSTGPGTRPGTASARPRPLFPDGGFEPAGPRPRPDQLAGALADAQPEAEHYELAAGAGQGVIARLSPVDYLKMEHYEGSYSVHWPTTTEPDRFLALAQSLGARFASLELSSGATDQAAEPVVPTDLDTRPIGQVIAQMGSTSPDDVAVVRTQDTVGQRALVWRRGAGPASPSQITVAAMAGDHASVELVEQLAHETAPAIGHLFSSLRTP